MNLISSYIIKRCSFNTLLILFSISMIYLISSVINEIGDIGKGNYTIFGMLVYMLLTLPSYIYLLIPLAVLIGVMSGMLSLVKNSEYAIMRTSGLSVYAIARILFIFGLFFAGITFLFGELIAPNTTNMAKLYKLNRINQTISSDLSSGIWTKDGEHTIVNIRQIDIANTHQVNGLKFFNYSNDKDLDEYITAKSAVYNIEQQSWILSDVNRIKYLESQVQITVESSYVWQSSIVPEYFNVLVIAPEEMSIFNLFTYINHLKNNNQATNRYEIALWSKLFYPLSCISMALIAIGFIPNNSRNINLAAKLFIGILIGVAFFFSNKIMGFAAVLFNWNAILSATIPTLILFIASIILVKRKT